MNTDVNISTNTGKDKMVAMIERNINRDEEVSRMLNSVMAERVQVVFDHWNSKNIMVHRKKPSMLSVILKRILDKYSLDDILMAIDNYAEVYHSNYWFNYKWNIETFLQKKNALPEFMDDGSKWVNYLNDTRSERNCEKLSPIPKPDDDIVIKSMEYPVITSNEECLLSEMYNKTMDALSSMPYQKYLQTEHWIHFKKETLKYFRFKCQLCNADDITLHVHHNNYENRGRETFSDVIVLCEDCHGKFHNKD